MRATLAIALLTLLASGCTNLHPEWNIDSNVDLSQKNRFQFAPEKPAGAQSPPADTVQHRELVRSLIRADLVAKGYSEDAASPDWVVYFSVGPSTEVPMIYYRMDERKGEVDIRVTATGSDDWVWHGWAEKTLTHRLDGEEEIRKAVPLILSKFPPAGGS